MEVPNIDEQFKVSSDELSMFSPDKKDSCLLNAVKDEDHQSVLVNDSMKLKNLIFAEVSEEISESKEFKSENESEALFKDEQKVPYSSLVSWVQCDRDSCQKWRLIENEVLPDESHKWECSMNKDPRRNKCEFSQETLPSDDDEEAVYTSFSSGDLVLGKMPGYPWWPGIVEDDPDFGSFFDCEKKGEKKLISYHVTFFGKEASRAWLHQTSIANFDGHEKLEDLGPLTYQGKSFRKKVLLALEEARKAFSMTEEKRLRKYSFVRRYIKENKKNRSKTKKKKINEVNFKVNITSVENNVSPKEKLTGLQINNQDNIEVEDLKDEHVDKLEENVLNVTSVPLTIGQELTPSQEHAEKMIEKYVSAEQLLAFKSSLVSIENISTLKKLKSESVSKSSKRKNQTNETLAAKKKKQTKKQMALNTAQVSNNKKNTNKPSPQSTGHANNKTNSSVAQNDQNMKVKKRKESNGPTVQSAIQLSNETKASKKDFQKCREKKKKKNIQAIGGKKTSSEACNLKEGEKALLCRMNSSSSSVQFSCEKVEIKSFQNVKNQEIKQLNNFEVIKQNNNLVSNQELYNIEKKAVKKRCSSELPTNVIEIKKKILPAINHSSHCTGKPIKKEMSKSVQSIIPAFNAKVNDTDLNKKLKTQNTTDSGAIAQTLTAFGKNKEGMVDNATDNDTAVEHLRVVSSQSLQVKPTFIKNGVTASKKSAFKAPVKNGVVNPTLSFEVSTTPLSKKPSSGFSDFSPETTRQVAENIPRLEAFDFDKELADEGSIDIGLEMNLAIKFNEDSPIVLSSSPEF